ncbi:MAG: ComEC/Rec2 family competence protein [Sarcina sp.]
MKMKKINLLALSAITSTMLLFAGCGSSAIENNKVISNNDKPAVESTATPESNKVVSDKETKPVTNDTNIKTFKDSEIHFINTGNSDAILIKGKKNVLIDGGDNNDESSLVQYIKNQGIKKIDYLVASHNHADHIGALDSVIDNLEIGEVLVSNGDGDTKTYKDFINSISAKKLSPSVPLANAKFDLGNGAYMQMLNTNGGSDTNEESLVTLYVNGEDKFLFTGDAEEGTEKEILAQVPDVDVLKVGHHGSKSSTSQSFLDKVNPEFAVITVGNDNKYNHPHKVVMDRLKSDSVKIHRTDECGNIVFKSTGKGIETACKDGSYSCRDGEKKEEVKKPVTTPSTDKVVENKPSESKPVETTKPKPTPAPTPAPEPTPEPAKPTKPEPTPAPEQGGIVWLSATGEKYHSKNNCGRMNPDSAREISLSDAKAQGFEDCSKC